MTQEASLSAFASAELVEAARRGGRESIDALVEAVWPGCYRVAFCVLGEAPLAEDAAQEACIALYRGIALLRDPASFNAWLYRIVVREATRARRRRSLEEAVTDGPAAVEPSGADLDIQRALASLSPALREVVVLYYFEDLTSREIAAILGIPDGTVRVRLMMARRKLRSTLTSYRELFALDDAGISNYAI